MFFKIKSSLHDFISSTDNKLKSKYKLESEKHRSFLYKNLFIPFFSLSYFVCPCTIISESIVQ